MLRYVLEKAMVGPYGDPISLQVGEAACAIFFLWILAGEVTGDGLRYSKFTRNAGITWPSRLGMFVLYLPSFLLASSFLLLKFLHSPLLPSSCNARLLTLTIAISIHFLKRLLEVLFVHKFSGSIEASMSILISAAYAGAMVVVLYAQQLAVDREAPAIDLMKWGVVVFFVGIVGNFYHHYLLATLRSDKNAKAGQKQYKIPQGGLFTWVVCPHYLFESICFFGFAMIGQTSVALLTVVGVSAYLCARSHKTRDWYLKKIKGFPPQRKPFFPFLF